MMSSSSAIINVTLLTVDFEIQFYGRRTAGRTAGGTLVLSLDWEQRQTAKKAAFVLVEARVISGHYDKVEYSCSSDNDNSWVE